jgi:integrase
MKTAIEWERLAKAGREGRLTEVQARRVVADLVEQATGEPLHFHSCRGWLDEWLSGKAGTTAEGTLTKYKQVIADFLEHLGARADLPLAAISPRDVRAFRDALAKGGRAASTVNLATKKTLNVPFAAAHRLGYIALNPVAGVEALKDRADNGRETFTTAQVLALADAAENDWRGAILAGYYTGLRLGDVASLLWESVDMDAAVLKVRTRKTGSAVAVPLHDELRTWLESQPRGIGKAPLLPSLIGKRTGGKVGLSAQFAKLIEKAGITRRLVRKGEGAGHRTSSLSFHSLRHSFNSALANAGVAQELRQKLTGHASAAMNDKYTHHEIETMRAAVAKLPGLAAAK